ncbi:MAG: hypothetical protein E6314_01165 [Enterobacter sp.]|uniref:hypothetical protein n=1 Tax=Enterobacter roggenkampii TaxID=1812935 RepID=UPI0013D1D2B6|nr:hypothetical protein [Enterobacter roggenkampii]MDU7097071.1 hypothetical protein [Enterobacter sp.]EKY3998597.1 hypothetical protein [Enterobacter roggenkampii]MCK7012023.1 hypothetical protein [Enterobacter roggenkampii]MCK7026399.1 hypothetical protein [Enterobacter roggenkampii]MDL0007967.1 hypothetical protein [Enterobacter roggenkampii]
MTTNDIFSIFVIFLFVLFLILVVAFYIDYRKHSSEVSEIYNSLTQAGLLRKEDYQVWEGLGFWGFGFRVTILSRLLRGKSVKLTDSRRLEAHACHGVLTDFELSWVYSYDKKIKFTMAIFILLLILASINGM